LLGWTHERHGRSIAGWAALLAACAAVLVGAAAARADGDPASDYLLTQRVFLTSQSTSLSPAQRQLTSLTAAAGRAGFPIRVAIISDEYDLGSITALWLKPRLYARFLGIELSVSHAQRLLVVMPNGFGFDWPGHPVAAEYRLLSHVRIGPGPAALATAAQTAERDLASASRVPLPSARGLADRRSRSAGSPAGWIIPVIAGGVLAALIGALEFRRRRRRGGIEVPATAARETGGPPWLKPRLAIPGMAALLVLAIGTPVVLLVGSSHGAAAGVNAGAIVTPPARSWPAGSQAAPAFALRDQNGRPVSISEFRGRPVILTFVDPLCRNLCPLEAHLLNRVVGSMPAAARPAIIAVSVDVYADKRADLLQDEQKWSLVPQWHWAVGRPSQLAAVWNHYRIGVSVVRKRIGRTTINYITHVEAAYVIDATGHERALFGWPFYPADLKRELQKLA
jgi:cytochrome oxidase Cu insertion factor (SCO1/SenC/PrrC family)